MAISSLPKELANVDVEGPEERGRRRHEPSEELSLPPTSVENQDFGIAGEGKARRGGRGWRGGVDVHR